MGQPSPRLGYYIVSIGTVLEFLGLVGNSWSGSNSPESRAVLSFGQPGDVLLVFGLAITVLGTILGLLSLARTLSEHVDRPPRLLPALPLVLLIGFSVGSVAFAYQAGSQSNATRASVSSQEPSALVTTTATPVCPPGTFWHQPTQRCLSVTADANGVAQAATPLAPGETPTCAAGTIWHPAGNHCLSTACPAGFVFNTTQFVCDLAAPATPGLSTGPSPTPVCPANTFWHPTMNHCMSTVCPIGYDWSWTALTCVQVAGPGPTLVPTSTPALQPGATPSPTSNVTPTLTAVPTPACPDGYFWHPAMGHCMSNTCPPGLVWDQDGLYCVLPSPSPTPG